MCLEPQYEQLPIETFFDSNSTFSIQGTSPSEIQEIRCQYTNFHNNKNNNINEIAKKYLGYIATVSYKNSDGQKAKEWVYANISNNRAKTEIGGVTFQIFAPTNMVRTLSISVPE